MFTTYFLQQNKLIKDGKHEIKEATELNVKTVGIINGLTDIEPMALGWLDYAMNNTYDHPMIDEETYKTLLTSMTDPKEGCFALLNSCRAAQARGDPEMKGNDKFPEVFFGATGDPARYDLSHLGKILDSGLNVAMVYGDRDYRCNCE